MDPLKRVLVEAIVNMAAFLEFSDEVTLDPDTAVNQMEDLAATLQKLTQEERHELLNYLSELADSSRKKGTDKEYVDFVLGFGEMFGVTEEEEVSIEELRKFPNFIETEDQEDQ